MKKILCILTVLTLLSLSYGWAGDTICATVQMQIAQQATLERQAFDATMTIHNGFPSESITDVTIDLVFNNEEGQEVHYSYDPDATEAVFFVGTPVLSSITAISNGVISAGESATVNWLIIPAPQSAGTNEEGAIYFVGADLSYTIAGDTKIVNVDADEILVKPMPFLIMDYFLPGDVYADDPTTTEVIEPAVAFPLGLRVWNVGRGEATELQVDSCQPEIVAAANGLMVGFQILSSRVGLNPVEPSLMVDMGSLAGKKAVMASWQMESTLSGIFTNFMADISHADELGGRLTSLIHETNIHAHIHRKDVVADLPGRDRIPDFLCVDDVLYESQATNTSVTDLSDHFNAELVSGSTYSVTVSNQPSDGYFYASMVNPAPSGYLLQSVTREDGKEIRSENAWIAHHYSGGDWSSTFNLFDASAFSTNYTAVFIPPSQSNHPPAIAYINDKFTGIGTNVSFLVVASDDGGSPELSCGFLPYGAEFTLFRKTNTVTESVFSWTPVAGQNGTCPIVFIADDGTFQFERTVYINVSGEGDLPYPRWWLTRQVIQTNASVEANDYAYAVMGQVKHMAAMAYQEFDELPGGAKFTLPFSTNNNYAVVTAGQLKNLATNFYGRIHTDYPWSGTGAQDYALVNIGQVKNVFNIDPFEDSDSDGMPDWWENHYFGGPTNAVATADPDEDSYNNLQEYLNDQDPGTAD